VIAAQLELAKAQGRGDMLLIETARLKEESKEQKTDIRALEAQKSALELQAAKTVSIIVLCLCCLGRRCCG
jgi:hypothetical protein